MKKSISKEQLKRIREMIPHGSRKELIKDLNVSEFYLNNVLSGNSIDINLLCKILDWIGNRLVLEISIKNKIEEILQILEKAKK